MQINYSWLFLKVDRKDFQKYGKKFQIGWNFKLVEKDELKGKK